MKPGDSTVELVKEVSDRGVDLSHGSVVIAAITSCTNTSNPSVMVAAGLLARNAVKAGLSIKPWVKPSLAPGSRVVTEYLEAANLDGDLSTLGFNTVGYGCTTCIGNSGPLDDDIESAIDSSDLVVGSVLSGNRNFEGRVHAKVKANYLASPPLVVAYAIAGHLDFDFSVDPMGHDSEGNPIMLADLWPSDAEISEVVSEAITPEMYRDRYADVLTEPRWESIPATTSQLYDWDPDSTYVRRPSFLNGIPRNIEPIDPIIGARALLMLGDSVTTDHISPAGAFASSSPAGQYLVDKGVSSRDFNSYGSRRGNHEVMMRGRAVIATSFERIHRSNLVGMGVLPLTFVDGDDANSLGLNGTESFDIPADAALDPGQNISIKARKEDGSTILFEAVVRLDTPVEVEYYRNGGILQTVLRGLAD